VTGMRAVLSGLEDDTGVIASVENLSVWIGGARAVADLSFELRAGERLGIVGESGSGKSMMALALIGLLPLGARAEGRVEVAGVNIYESRERDIAGLRGARVGFVFQDALTALNPVVRVGAQVAEMYRRHLRLSRREATERAGRVLSRVGIPDVRRKMRSYPHELSGGQRQRVMIAIAMACSPLLLVADEPTTALDVTLQGEILHLMDDLVRDEGSALLFISHDLPVIGSLCETVAVMYGGRIVEYGPASSVFGSPRHPYTAGLLRAQPSGVEGSRRRRLDVIPGVVPPLGRFPEGCAFRDRCECATTQCETSPSRSGVDHWYCCWHALSARHEGSVGGNDE
jgi:peptide/nickel transport system ATP-binding protein